MKKLEFFYDCSSPWTYLAFNRIEDLARRHHADLIWRPILVGGVFNAVNPSVYESRERPVKAKARYYNKDMQDWARCYGITLKMPTVGVAVVKVYKTMRGAYVADEHGRIAQYTRRAFVSYWVEDRNIGDEAVIADISRQAGLDPGEVLDKIQQPEYKEKLRAATQELIDRGGFGSPTIFVDGSMFFGNDRLPLVEFELSR
ncbi:MAG TPA: 2-hydroxychromene-2-carboxylate isomerase [Candidatus Binataceae bacterium]|nr:2-hydroxychromene-2-carboxylate isomerase [Candidatus Binataceae bacterium]